MLNIKKINYDENFDYGCETCDYGSSYVNEIEIIFEDGTYTNIKVDKMYEYALSESDYIKLISESDNVESLCINIIKLTQKEFHSNSIEWLANIEHLNITINGEKINIIKTFSENKLIKE